MRHQRLISSRIARVRSVPVKWKSFSISIASACRFVVIATRDSLSLTIAEVTRLKPMISAGSPIIRRRSHPYRWLLPNQCLHCCC